MNENISTLFEKHKKWLETEGESGEQLVLEGIDSELLSREQLRLLTDSILTECCFSDTELKEIDFYHSELYSCVFKKAFFCKSMLIKAEVNDTTFTDTRFENVSFSNAEMFDCTFNRCLFTKSTFVCVGIWNSVFNSCTFSDIDFDSAYLENIVVSDSKFINPINLDKATKIELNIGTAENPMILSHADSIKWIQEHSVS